MNDFLLTEDGGFLLQEDSNKIIKGVTTAPQGRDLCDRSGEIEREIVDTRDSVEERILI